MHGDAGEIDTSEIASPRHRCRLRLRRRKGRVVWKRRAETCALDGLSRPGPQDEQGTTDHGLG